MKISVKEKLNFLINETKNNKYHYRVMTKVKLEQSYLMSVVQYLDSIETLDKILYVSKNCGEAIVRTKVNPNYNQKSLKVAITNTRLESLKKELKYFENVQTLSIDADTLESLDDETCLLYI